MASGKKTAKAPERKPAEAAAEVSGRRIIVAKEKNYTRYLEASTDEQWTKSALALLTERFNSDEWYWDPQEDAEDMSEFAVKRRNKEGQLLGISEETLAALPAVVQADLRKKIDEVKRGRLDDAEGHREHMAIKQVVESQDLSWVGKGSYARPKAWALLEQRSGGEYEDVELEDVEIPG